MSIPEAFEHHARAILVDYPDLNAHWKVISNGNGRELFIPKQGQTGFDVSVQAEPNGLYPFAGDWHGPPWELSPTGIRPLDERIAERCIEFLGFIRTLLCEDACLHVHYAGRRPFKWVLVYQTELGSVSDACGMFVFNYFGKRTVRQLQNRHLPRRYDVPPNHCANQTP